MRIFIAELERQIEKALQKWKQASRMEDGSVVQIEYQFEQSHVELDIFWKDSDERLSIVCRTPHMTRKDNFKGLDAHTIKAVMDRVGNFAQIVQGRMSK